MEWNFGAILAASIGVLGSAFGYLLSRKDSHQADQITDLFRKHETDASRLQDLEIKVAADHYPKHEINAILSQLRSYLDEKFDRIEKALEHKA
jgi:uncharacterized coiled-coil protein SlyX